MAMAKKMKIEEPSTQRHVPYDIILQILYRLPANTLLRFTSVSKSWKASIISPNFISAHHQINKDISCSHLVHMQLDGRKYCTLIPESGDRELARTPFPPSRPSVSIVGSSEGLICLRTYYDVYLWNPFVRSMKHINPGQIRGLYTRFGFGFAPQSRDHKIVKLSKGGGGYLSRAEVYSLSLHSWTRIKSSGRLERYKDFSFGSNVCFKGCIYWLVHFYNSKSTILRIDLDKQEIEEIEIDLEIDRSTAITVVNGFLVLLKSTVKSGIESYIYQESSSSWTAVRIVDLPIGKTDVVAITGSGHIIFERSPGRIFACDGYYDGFDLSFKLRDLEIKVPVKLSLRHFGLITPIKETLHFLDEEHHRLVRYGRRRKGKSPKHLSST